MQQAIHDAQSLPGLLTHLIELEYDTQAAFEAASARVKSATLRTHIQSFLADQKRHIRDLKKLAAPWCDTVPSASGYGHMLTRGLLTLVHLAGDQAILHALARPLAAMNRAYEQAISKSFVPSEVLCVVHRHFMDERRHRDWVVRSLHPEDVTCADGVARHDDAIFELNNRPPMQFQSHNAN